MKNIVNNKNARFLIVFAFLATILLFNFSFADAQAETPEPPTGREKSGLASTDTGSGWDSIWIRIAMALPVALMRIVLLIIETILWYILGFVSYLLDASYNANITLSLTSNLTAITAWSIMRDLANGIFILLILWVAFTIIFNLENLGGKKFLVRIIIIAVLINFSLAMVNAVFSFNNLLAYTFKKQMPDDIARFIVEKTKILTVRQELTYDDVTKLAQTRQTQTPPQQPTSENNKLKKYALSLFGLTPASADFELSADPVGEFEDLVRSYGRDPDKITAAALSEKGRKLETALENGFKGFFENNFDRAWQLAVSVFLLAILVYALFFAALALLMRHIMAVLLGILAPVALLTLAIPSQKISKHWDAWLEKLFQWAFFAPVFYFLIYIAMLILASGSKTLGNDKTNIIFDQKGMFLFIITAAMLIIAAKYARKSSGMLGNLAVSALKGVGAGALAATGVGAAAVAARTLPATLAEGGALRKGIDRMRETPGFRYLGGKLHETSREYLARHGEKIEKTQKGWEGATAKDVGMQFSAKFNPAERLGLGLQFVKKANKAELEQFSREGKMSELSRLASQFGMSEQIGQSLLKKGMLTENNYRDFVPGATSKQDAAIGILEKMEDKKGLSRDALKDPSVIIGLLANIKGSEDTEHLARRNAEAYRSMLALVENKTSREGAKELLVSVKRQGGKGIDQTEFESIIKTITDYETGKLRKRGGGGSSQSAQTAAPAQKKPPRPWEYI